MRRAAWVLLGAFVGVTATLLIQKSGPKKPPQLPPISFSEPLTVRRLEPPQGDLIVLKPYLVILNGTPQKVGSPPDDPTQAMEIAFDDGRLVVTCARTDR